jgi:ABC-2 type transport system permease protein
MTNLVAAEFLKLRTTRTFWWVAGLALALSLLVTILTLATSTFEDVGDARSLVSNMGIPGLFMIVLGVVGAAGEYRHGTITSTFLVAPDRRRVLLAKAVAYALGGLAVGVVSAALTLAISAPWLAAQGNSLSALGLDTGDLAQIVGGAIAYLAISGVLGVAVGALLTNQVTAVVAVFVVLLVIDPAVAALAHPYGKFSLQGLGMKLSGSSSANAGYELLPLGVSALLYLGYAVAVLAATAAIAMRRDVT